MLQAWIGGTELARECRWTWFLLVPLFAPRPLCLPLFLTKSQAWQRVRVRKLVSDHGTIILEPENTKDDFSALKMPVVPLDSLHTAIHNACHARENGPRHLCPDFLFQHSSKSPLQARHEKVGGVTGGWNCAF